MKKIFVKVNENRIKRFQVKTYIYENGRERFVVKQAAFPEAEEHLLNMYESQEGLSLAYPHLEICRATLEEKTLRFDYISGQPFTKLFFDAMHMYDREKFYCVLDTYIELICPKSQDCVFTQTRHFIEIFGDHPELNGTDAFSVYAFDITSNNLILPHGEDKKPVLIDYEWSFDFPIPKSFFIFRCIYSMYSVFREFEEFEPFSKLAEYLKLVDQLPLYYDMNDAMLSYLTKENLTSYNQEDFLKCYLKKSTGLQEMIASLEQKEYAAQLLEAVEQKNEYIQVLETQVDSIKQKDCYIAALEAKMGLIEQKDSYIADLESKMGLIEQKDSYIADLESKMGLMEQKDSYIADLESKMGLMEQKDSYIADLESKMELIEQKDSYIADLESKMGLIEQKDVYIRELEEQVALIKAKNDYIAFLQEDAIQQQRSFEQKELEMEAQLGEINEKLSQARATIFDMEQSLSWRITKILRRKKQ